MFTHRTEARVRYAETDRMGYVYYGNYATYFELGRVEAMRVLGIPYDEMEKQGIIMPVLKLEVNYRKPAFYDETLTIETTVKHLPKTRMDFEYVIRNERGDLLTTGFTQLVFVNAQTRRPQRAPEVLVKALVDHFSKH